MSYYFHSKNNDKTQTQTSNMEVCGVKFNIFCFVNVSSPKDVDDYIKNKHPNLCVLDGSLVVSVSHLSSGVLNAISTQKMGVMRSKSIYMEILRCLSPDGRLSGALKHLVITENTTEIVIITFESNIPVIPGIGDEIDVDTFFSSHSVDYSHLREIFQIDDNMLHTYTYEEIILTTLAVVSSDLVRSHSL